MGTSSAYLPSDRGGHSGGGRERPGLALSVADVERERVAQFRSSFRTRCGGFYMSRGVHAGRPATHALTKQLLFLLAPGIATRVGPGRDQVRADNERRWRHRFRHALLMPRRSLTRAELVFLTYATAKRIHYLCNNLISYPSDRWSNEIFNRGFIALVIRFP